VFTPRSRGFADSNGDIHALLYQVDVAFAQAQLDHPFRMLSAKRLNASARMFTPTGNGAVTLSVPAGSARRGVAATPCSIPSASRNNRCVRSRRFRPPASASATA